MLDDIAPVRLDREDRPHSEGASYYSYRTNTLWLGVNRDYLDFGAVATHEMSHYYLHASTPYGFFLRRLAHLSDSCVLGYCLDFQKAFGGRRIPYPIYLFSREWLVSEEAQTSATEKSVLTQLVEKHVKPWSRFRFLLDVIEGSGWGDLKQSVERAQDFLNRSPKKALDFLLEFEAMDAIRFPVRDKADDSLLTPYACPSIPEDMPACPLLTDHLGRVSAFGGHQIFEGLAQAVELTADITAEKLSQHLDYWGLWLAAISEFQVTQSSRETANKLLATFLAVCDLSLFTPIGALYGVLRTDTMDWTDIHPGFRFRKALKAGGSIGFLTELSSDKLLEYQEKICTLLGWPSPRKFVQLGMLLKGDKELEYEHMIAALKRFRDHSIYLRFMTDQLSEKEIQDLVPVHLPLIKPSRSDRLLVQSHALDTQRAIDQMMSYFLPQWSDAVMVRDRLNYEDFLPGELTIWEPASSQFLSKGRLMRIILEGLPCARPEKFVHFREVESVV